MNKSKQPRCTCKLKPGGVVRNGSRFVRTHRRATCPAWTPQAADLVVALWGNPGVRP